MNKIKKRVLLGTVLLSFYGLQAKDIYVSVGGNCTNTGTITSPLDFVSGLEQLKDAPTTEANTLYVKGGRYSFSSAVTLDENYSGTAEFPNTIKAYPGEEVIFDGGKSIGGKGFSAVKSKKERARLSASSADKIRVKTIKDKELIAKLSSDVIMLLSIDGGIYLPSCFPNSGYSELNLEQTVKEVAPPAVAEFKSARRAGVGDYNEPGKPQGWRGTLDEPRGSQVGFATRTDEMGGTWQQWANEIKANNERNQLSGFVAAHWLLSRMPIYDVNAQDETIHLAEVMNYGWGCINDKIFKVYGLLCEVDQPGEWYFDVKSKRLYIYPPNEITAETPIGLPYSDGFMTLDGVSYLSIENVAIQNVGSGVAIDMKSGEYNTIAGCKFSNCTAKGVNVSGTNNGVLSCDFVDLAMHVSLNGGVRSPEEITPAYNYVQNCHFYQKFFNHEKVNIGVSGVGNTFKNNLVHNSIGQAMMIGGNDLIFEQNELFNIGYDEGDGGAMYAGGDLTGYGTVYKHNFLHHLMHVPGKVERAGIHLDDLQAGATCIGNVFYKSASKGIFMNSGSGNVIRDNVNLDGGRTIYNVGAGSARNYERQVKIYNTTDPALLNSKENYVGNAEKKVGNEGWNNPVWKSKYPRFVTVMNDKGEFGRMWPIRNVVENNYAYNNALGDTTIWSRFAPEAQAKSILRNDVKVSPEWFVDYEGMNFAFKKELKNVPYIPFESIGLYLDEYRTAMPDKSYYRKAIKEFYKDESSHYPGSSRHIDTAELLENGPSVE